MPVPVFPTKARFLGGMDKKICLQSPGPGLGTMPLQLVPTPCPPCLTSKEMDSSDLQLHVSFLICGSKVDLLFFPKGYDRIVHKNVPGPDVGYKDLGPKSYALFYACALSHANYFKRLEWPKPCGPMKSWRAGFQVLCFQIKANGQHMAGKNP